MTFARCASLVAVALVAACSAPAEPVQKDTAPGAPTDDGPRSPAAPPSGTNDDATAAGNADVALEPENDPTVIFDDASHFLSPGAAALGVVGGHVYWDVASRVCGKDPHCTPNDGIAAGAVAGGSPTIIEPLYIGGSASGAHVRPLSFGAHLAYQRAGEVNVVLAGTTTKLALPSAPSACSALTSDTAHVYCREGSGRVVSWSLTGGKASAPVTVATDLPPGDGLVVVGDDLLFSSSPEGGTFGAIYMKPIGTEAGSDTRTTLVEGITLPMRGLVRGKAHIAWHAAVTPWQSGTAHDEVWVQSLAGGAPRMIASGEWLEVALSATDDVAYVVDRGSSTSSPEIRRVDLTTGAITALSLPSAAATSLRGAMGIAVDDTHVYWSAIGGQIRRFPK